MFEAVSSVVYCSSLNIFYGWNLKVLLIFLLAREVTGETDLLPGVTGAMGGHSAWLQGLRSPLIKEVFSTPDPGQNKYNI